MLQNYALGDFSNTIEIPEEEDEFTELLVGMTLMVDDFREMITEREHTIVKLQDAESALRYSKEQMKNRLEMIQLMFAISNKFLTLSFENLDDEINLALKKIADFVGANRSSLFVFSDDLNTITNTHEWVASEADSQIDLLQGIPFETFGHHAKSLLKHEIIAISKIVDYPPEAEAELAWVKEYGFRSMLFVPLTSEGKLFGTLGFYGEVGDTIIWSNLFLQLLTVIGDIFVNTFSRQKSDEILANRIQEMERFNRMAVGREHRMVELKRQVNEYAARLGEEPLFDISFTGD